jgi:hypothetical protein
MHYMVTIYNTEAAITAIEGPDREEFERAHRTVNEELRASGEFVDSHELSDRDARVVRIERDGPVVTDGPVVHAKAWVGGYYVVDCVDIDRAVEIAGRFVEGRYAPVEVRRIVVE